MLKMCLFKVTLIACCITLNLPAISNAQHVSFVKTPIFTSQSNYDTDESAGNRFIVECNKGLTHLYEMQKKGTPFTSSTGLSLCGGTWKFHVAGLHRYQTGSSSQILISMMTGRVYYGGPQWKHSTGSTGFACNWMTGDVICFKNGTMIAYPSGSPVDLLEMNVINGLEDVGFNLEQTTSYERDVVIGQDFTLSMQGPTPLVETPRWMFFTSDIWYYMDASQIADGLSLTVGSGTLAPSYCASYWSETADTQLSCNYTASHEGTSSGYALVYGSDYVSFTINFGGIPYPGTACDLVVGTNECYCPKSDSMLTVHVTKDLVVTGDPCEEDALCLDSIETRSGKAYGGGIYNFRCLAGAEIEVDFDGSPVLLGSIPSELFYIQLTSTQVILENAIGVWTIRMICSGIVMCERTGYNPGCIGDTLFDNCENGDFLTISNKECMCSIGDTTHSIACGKDSDSPDDIECLEHHTIPPIVTTTPTAAPTTTTTRAPLTGGLTYAPTTTTTTTRRPAVEGERHVPYPEHNFEEDQVMRVMDSGILNDEHDYRYKFLSDGRYNKRHGTIDGRRKILEYSDEVNEIKKIEGYVGIASAVLSILIGLTTFLGCCFFCRSNAGGRMRCDIGKGFKELKIRSKRCCGSTCPGSICNSSYTRNDYNVDNTTSLCAVVERKCNCCCCVTSL